MSPYMDGKKPGQTRDHDAERGTAAREPAREHREEVVRFGISAAPGIVIGRAFVIDTDEDLSVGKMRIPHEMVDAEVAKFKGALDATREELLQIKTSLAESMG